MPSYHDLHVTAPGIERRRIFDLPYGYEVICNRVTGWRLYRHPDRGTAELLGGEYDGEDEWLILDIDGHVIVNSRDRGPA